MEKSTCRVLVKSFLRPQESMQTLQQISLEQLNEIVKAVFAQGPVVVRQAYS